MAKFSTLYFRFSAYYLIFGLVVALIASVVNYYFRYQAQVVEVRGNADFIAEGKKDLIRFTTLDIENKLSSIASNSLFAAYLSSPTKEHTANVQDLLLSHLVANKLFFQVRYLDKEGMEQVRVEKRRGTAEPVIVNNDELQDKSDRYYFQETIRFSSDQVWRSNLDLNIENGRIEDPIRPTLRFAKQVFHDGKLVGILIVNTDMSRLIFQLRQSSRFSLYIADGEGYFLIHEDSRYDWGRYLEHGSSIKSLLPQWDRRIADYREYHTQDVNVYSLSEEFGNKENLKLVLFPKDEYLKGIESHNMSASFYLTLVIFALSIPCALLLAAISAKVEKKSSESINNNRS